MVLGNHGKGFTAWLFGPVARRLVAWGVSPDAVTVAGTVVVVVAALWLFPTGHLAVGALVIGVVAFTDSLDGVMARLSGRTGPFGAFLDSTMDRFSDSAIFAGLALYFVALPDDDAWRLAGIAGALACLALGGLVSYARARAEAVGMTAQVGIAERADRLIVSLAATLAVGLGAPTAVLTIALVLLSLASLFTVGQRILAVRRQAAALVGAERAGETG